MKLPMEGREYQRREDPVKPTATRMIHRRSRIFGAESGQLRPWPAAVQSAPRHEVTAPSAADDTDRAYFAMTPVV